MISVIAKLRVIMCDMCFSKLSTSVCTYRGPEELEALLSWFYCQLRDKYVWVVTKFCGDDSLIAKNADCWFTRGAQWHGCVKFLEV